MLVMGAANASIGLGKFLNIQAGSSVPWFAVFAVAVSLVTLRLCDKGYQPVRMITSARRLRWVMIALLFGVLLALLALGLMDSSALRAGRVTLPGDIHVTTSPVFRTVASYTKAFAAGPIEEGAIRGLVQLGLTRTIEPRWAELIADGELVLSHGSRLLNPGELVLVSATAFATGRLTAKTQNTRYAVLAHCTSNVLIVSGVLLLRYH
jgi:hypothetical protein